jgi:hypothetical protein
MYENDKDIKITGKLDSYKGTLKIDILDILENLDEETKKEIISDGGWWSLIEKQMAEAIVKEFSRESFNEEYTKLRGLIINSESMPAVIREWAISVLESLERAKEAERYWDQAYWELYHWTTDKFESQEHFYQDVPRLPDHYYGKEYSKELMKDVEKEIQEWKLFFPDKAKDE